MCGVAGYFGPRPPDDERVARTLALMRRRGPDRQDSRRFAVGDRQAVLLHSRLGIIDLEERADQPFTLGGKCIVFNGEIYNYRELAQALEAEGRTLATRSDTEALLAAIDAWGWEALDRCEGMWAFAVFDAADGSLTLSRDRFGEKPLLVLHDADGGVWFGSEPTFIAALSGRRLAIDPDHVRRFLVNGYKALHKQPGGFFRDVREIPPAGALRIGRDGREEPWRYWLPDLDPEPFDIDFETAAAGVRERLVRAVDLRLRADVPLAFCLSGGVDSNSLVGIARRVLGHDVHGFTIANTDSRYEESAAVEATVRALGIRHTTIPLDPGSFLPRLRALVARRAAPVYTINYYLHWLLEEAVAAAGYRISISGTAADELFTGYYDHHLGYLHAVRNDAALFERALADWKTHIAPLVRNPFLKNPRLFIDDPRERRHIYLDADAFAAALTRPWREPFVERHYARDLLRNRMLNELFDETTPPILHEDDRNAMDWSVENRSPFLDRDLFEYSLRIPTRHLVRDGAAKAVLRRAMRGIAPDHILDDRRKVGFNAPIEDLLDGRDPAVRRELLNDSPVFGYVRREAVAALLDRRAFDNSYSKFLFSFVSTKMFLEEFGP